MSDVVPATENEGVNVATVCPVDQVGVPVEQAVVSETVWPTVAVSELATMVGVFMMVAVSSTKPVVPLLQPLLFTQYM